jgi:hypothetical protein
MSYPEVVPLPCALEAALLWVVGVVGGELMFGLFGRVSCTAQKRNLEM